MKMQLDKISESEFLNLNLPILFQDELTDRVFAIISNGEKKYKLGWQSTEIEPVIVFIDNNHCSVGIDLTFIIFNFNTGEIFQKISLDYYFYDTQIFNGFMYVITQLEIIKINIINMIIVKRFDLPEYFESFNPNENIIAVECMGGEIIFID